MSQDARPVARWLDEIDEGDLAHAGKLCGDRAWVARIDGFFVAADELDGLAVLDID